MTYGALPTIKKTALSWALNYGDSFLTEVRIDYAFDMYGEALYAVRTAGGQCLNADAKWAEDEPGNASDAWLENHRFPLEHAELLAHMAARDLYYGWTNDL